MSTSTAAAASTGLKTKFGYRPFGSASGTVYSYLATVSKIQCPKESYDEAEATILASTQKDYVRSLADREASLTIRRDLTDPTFAQIKSDLVYSATSNYDFIVTFSDGSTQTFSGYVKEWAPSEIVPTEVMSVDLTIRVISPTVDTPAPAPTS